MVLDALDQALAARNPDPDTLIHHSDRGVQYLAIKYTERLEEAKALLRKTVPIARRVLRENNHLTLRMRLGYAAAIYRDPGATLEDLREAVTTLEETERAARRVLGGAHPTTAGTGEVLQEARAALSAREG